MAWIHQMLVRTAIKEDPDLTATLAGCIGPVFKILEYLPKLIDKYVASVPQP